MMQACWHFRVEIQGDMQLREGSSPAASPLPLRCNAGHVTIREAAALTEIKRESLLEVQRPTQAHA